MERAWREGTLATSVQKLESHAVRRPPEEPEAPTTEYDRRAGGRKEAALVAERDDSLVSCRRMIFGAKSEMQAAISGHFFTSPAPRMFKEPTTKDTFMEDNRSNRRSSSKHSELH
jgi:hypothetical protein